MASFVWVIALTIMGALASRMTDPFAQNAMLVAVVLCGIGAIIAFRREHQAQGDLATSTTNELRNVSGQVRSLSAKVDAFIEKGGISRDSPEYKEIVTAEESIQSSLAAIAQPWVATGYAPRITVTDAKGRLLQDSEGTPEIKDDE